jgi:N utilization substance protein A
VSAEREVRQEIRNRALTTDATSFGRQSGDLQGLSRDEQADSESVDELVEEGNAFEADAVAGVEEADDSDEKEVHTHEVPEDDVPDEYLDQD